VEGRFSVVCMRNPVQMGERSWIIADEGPDLYGTLSYILWCCISIRVELASPEFIRYPVVETRGQTFWF
jgi:hypothetical protein